MHIEPFQISFSLNFIPTLVSTLEYFVFHDNEHGRPLEVSRFNAEILNTCLTVTVEDVIQVLEVPETGFRGVIIQEDSEEDDLRDE